MNSERPCGCKGIRTCLKCEKDYNLEKPSLFEKFQLLNPLTFCPKCECLYTGWDVKEICLQHPEHNGEKGIHFPGILVSENFLTTNEGEHLMTELDKLPWDISQSGRRKQNYGPKTNFNKRRLRNGLFNGFPETTKFVQERLKEVEILKDFQTIEQCSLEYDPEKGASIDPHIDDCWIWGERVVTVNCLGDSVLTLTLYDSSKLPRIKYNLDVVTDYEHKLKINLASNDELQPFKNSVIRIPMPNLSLIVLYGPPRYQYEHAVLREDICERRVCIAYREFTPVIKGKDTCSQSVLVTENAKRFWNNEKLPNLITI